MTVRPLRDRLWQKRLAAIEEPWTAAREGQPDGVHRLRVGSRRIREVLPLLNDSDHPRRLKRVRRKVRTLTRTLGPVRERDVSLALLSSLEEAYPDDRAAIDLVRDMIAAERKEYHEALERRLEALPLKKLVKKLTRVAAGSKKSTPHKHRMSTDAKDTAADTKDARTKPETNNSDERWQMALAIRVARRAKQLHQAIEHAGALYATDRLHGARVTTKKLRYALELGQESRLGRWSAAIRMLKDVQDILGQLHDREALLDRLRAFDASQGNLDLSESLQRLTLLLEEDAGRYHAKFVRRHEPLLKLCATIRQEASHAIPIGRPSPRRIADTSKRVLKEELTVRPVAAR